MNDPFITHEDAQQLVDWLDGVSRLAEGFGYAQTDKATRLRDALTAAMEVGGDISLIGEGRQEGYSETVLGVAGPSGHPRTVVQCHDASSQWVELRNEEGEKMSFAPALARQVGKLLCKAEDLGEEKVCQCWNEGQYGRVHREDCPIHKPTD